MALTHGTQLVVQFADIRILAFGVLNRAGTMLLNTNSHAFLHPPGIERDTSPGDDDAGASYHSQSNLRDSGISMDRSSRVSDIEAIERH